MSLRRIDPEPEHLSIADRSPDSLMRRLDELAREAAHPLRGFPLGRMKKRGELGDNAQAKFDAASWFWQLYTRHQSIIGAKGSTPQLFEQGSRGEPPDPASDVGKSITRTERRIMRDYTSAKLAALACGAEAYVYFLAVVIDEHEPNCVMKQAVAQVADALRRHRAANSRHRQGNRA